MAAAVMAAASEEVAETVWEREAETTEVDMWAVGAAGVAAEAGMKEGQAVCEEETEAAMAGVVEETVAASAGAVDIGGRHHSRRSRSPTRTRCRRSPHRRPGIPCCRGRCTRWYRGAGAGVK